MVYSFILKLMTFVKFRCPQLKKVYFFSVGCAGQYKNRYSVTNLRYHEEDFGLSCEWHFFATSHGKNACDGIGGTVKRATARASLQRNTRSKLLHQNARFNFVKKTTFIFVTTADLKDAEELLEHRFKDSRVIPGTQKYHRFVPLNKEEWMVYPISSGIEEKKNIRQSFFY